MKERNAAVTRIGFTYSIDDYEVSGRNQTKCDVVARSMPRLGQHRTSISLSSIVSYTAPVFSVSD
jgi:hypothetical protein